MVQAVSTSSFCLGTETLAAALVEYADEKDKFTIAVPDGWLSGEGDLLPPANRFSNTAGMARVVGFAPPGKSDVNVSITVTPIGPDYTRLGSFGDAQTFGQNLVASMDRSYLLRTPAWVRQGEEQPQVARLLEAREINDQYYVSYSIKKANEPGRLVRSVVAIGNNGRTRRFYTVNASCLDSDAAEYGDLLQRVVKTFKVPAAVV
ncbi:hypothetical protein N2152v2_003666 [Parachlorella kessleri]